MYVEDLLFTVYAKLLRFAIDEWERKFILSVGTQLAARRQLSTKQSQTILRIIGRLKPQIIAMGLINIDELEQSLAQPLHRQEPYTSFSIPNEMRYLGSNLLGFRFKMNTEVIEAIRAMQVAPVLRRIYPHNRQPSLEGFRSLEPRFNGEHKLWIVPLGRHNIAKVKKVIADYGFHLDATTAQYLALAERSLNQPSQFAAFEDTLLVNVCDNPVLAGWITEVAQGIIL